jgi:glycosyltransferase involved in cell wall biosynthesis
MPSPLVTVVCLCYNHSSYLQEAIESVLNQTYKNIQIIVVDDASTDESVVKIDQLGKQYPSLELLMLKQNVGNCKAFNSAVPLIKGNFIIDFATDDVMLPDRIERQIDFFSALDNSTGVVFMDAIYIDSNGKFLRNHYEYLVKKNLLTHIPQGDIYRDVLTTYFIASPTMMMTREVLDALGGYDENLAYEDFDFWIRSSRLFKYAFLNEKLTKIRRTGSSMSTGWYVTGDKQLHSTYLVCKKAQQLNRNSEDSGALVKRVRYELRQSVFSENHVEAELFYALLIELGGRTLIDRIYIVINKLHLPLSGLRNGYHRFRFS